MPNTWSIPLLMSIRIRKSRQKGYSLIYRRSFWQFNATIENSVLRTWIYTPHVDADYPGIVKARKDLFERINLTKETHYIASTGIQGGTGGRFMRVSMDAYAVTGIPEENIRYIHAPEFMCPTHDYGVTFERATAVKLGQTDFLFISGTASIDKNGDVVHPGDIENQTVRTLAEYFRASRFRRFCQGGSFELHRISQRHCRLRLYKASYRSVCRTFACCLC